MKIVVGLGNPGKQYEGTRHNVGFEVIEVLAKRHNIAVTKRNFRAVFGEGAMGGERVLLVRPMTFMNLSGDAVAALCRYYKVPPEEVIVILDDIALDVGRLRLRFKGSAGGHNGLANIIKLLHTEDIPRVRVGVGSPRPGAMVDHVLSRFGAEEREAIENASEKAADAIECAVREGFEKAMNRFNLSDKPAKESPHSAPPLA